MRRSAFLLLNGALLAAAEPVIREDFRVVEAHLPLRADDLNSPFLKLQLLGPGAEKVKLSHHPEVANDPHYVWNGQCPGPVLLAFPLQHGLDLRAGDSAVLVRTKNAGASRLHLALLTGDTWIVQGAGVEREVDWSEHTLRLRDGTWHVLDTKAVKIGEMVEAPDWSGVKAIGFACPVTPKGSKDCIRLDWFELRSSSAKKSPAPGAAP